MIFRVSRVSFLMLLIVYAVPAARAAFVNGRESFIGTTLDTTTWEPFSPFVGNAISQNDALRINSTGSAAYADYTTHTLTVGPGQTVRAQMTVIESTTGSQACILLTTNSAGTTAYTFADDASISICTHDTFIAADVTRPQGGGGRILRQSGQAPGTTLIYEITRNSHASATFNIRDLANHLIGTSTLDDLSNVLVPPIIVPDQLHIALFSYHSAIVEWRYVEVVSSVPEPAAFFAILTTVPLFHSRRLLRRK